MDERNELNDIILNRHGDAINSKRKVILAVGVLATILVAVIMIMKTSVTNGTDNLPQAQQGLKSDLPPQPPVPQATQDKQSDDPLFKPVEIVKENSKSDADLDKIAQKLKQESLSKDNPPVASQNEQVQNQAQPQATTQTVQKSVPAPTPAVENKHVAQQEAVVKKVQPQTVESKEVPSKKETQVKKEIVAKKELPVKKEPALKKESLFAKDEPKKESLFAKETTVKKDVKKETAPSEKEDPKKAAAKTANDGKYYVQVGSFSKAPGDKFYSSIKKLGYEYQASKLNEVEKVSVGPFKTEAEAREALKALRKNVEPGAFMTKK